MRFSDVPLGSIGQIRNGLMALLLALGLTPLAGWSQSDSRTRTGFWFPDGPVNAIFLITNQTIYLGGNFNYVGPQTGPLAVYDMDDGVPIRTPRVAGIVYAAVPDGAGGWFIGGQFTRVGDTPRTHLAHLRADLSLDPTWDARISGQYVYCLHLSDGKLYIGGQFTQIGAVRQSNLATLDPANAQLLPWNPDVSGAVYNMVKADDLLYIAGAFSSIGNSNRNYIASLNISTARATGWNPNADSQVLVLSVAGNTVYIGGQFTSVGGKPRNRLAALDATTGTALTWNPNPNGIIRAMAVSDNAVYVGGDFTTISVQNRRAFAAINRANGAALPLDPEVEGQTQRLVRFLRLDGTVLYLAGSFQRLGGERRPLLAAIDLASGQWITNRTIPVATDYNGSYHDAAVNTVVIHEGRLLLGGDFQSAGGVNRRHAAALSAAEGGILPWTVAPSHPLYSLAFGHGRVYVGGAFTNLNAAPASALAAVDPITGQLDDSFVLGATNANGTPAVRCLLLVDTNLYVGGEFTGVGDKNVRYLALVDPASGQAQGFDAKITGGSQGVAAIALAGETLYFGGDFTSVAAKSRPRLAAARARDGAAVEWAPTPNNEVRAMAVSGDRLYVGGSFTRIGTIDLRNLAVFELPSHTLLPFDAALQQDADGINAIAASDTCLFLAGQFESIGGEFRKNMAALGPWSGQAFEWNPSPSASPLALATSAELVCFGGAFRGVAVSGQSYYPVGYFAAYSRAPWIMTNRLSGGMLTFEATTGDQLRVLLQASSDFSNWTSIATNEAPGYRWTVEQPIDGSSPQRFFRLVSE